jgi:hypothetical protein
MAKMAKKKASKKTKKVAKKGARKTAKRKNGIGGFTIKAEEHN